MTPIIEYGAAVPRSKPEAAELVARVEAEQKKILEVRVITGSYVFVLV